MNLSTAAQRQQQSVIGSSGDGGSTFLDAQRSQSLGGMFLFVFGFLFEIMADHQKSVFRRDDKNKDKFIHHGLWALTRHPNYFGEITLWLGITLCATSGMKTREQFASCLFSPLFIYLLLNFVSGIPPLEKAGAVKWGTNKAYQNYCKTTPVLFPFIGGHGKKY